MSERNNQTHSTLGQLLTDEEKERIKDVRAKMYYIYRPKTVEQYKVAACVVEDVNKGQFCCNLGQLMQLFNVTSQKNLFVSLSTDDACR